MAEVKKQAVAKVIATANKQEGILYTHKLEEMPSLENKLRYTIRPQELLIEVNAPELKNGSVIYDSFGCEWTIVEILQGQPTYMYDSNLLTQ